MARSLLGKLILIGKTNCRPNHRWSGFKALCVWFLTLASLPLSAQSDGSIEASSLSLAEASQWLQLPGEEEFDLWQDQLHSLAPLPGLETQQVLRDGVEANALFLDLFLEAVRNRPWPEIHGPETGFPEATLFRAAARLLFARVQLTAGAGGWKDSFIALEQLWQLAMHVSSEQQGLLPYLAAVQLVQTSLDATYWLLRREEMPMPQLAGIKHLLHEAEDWYPTALSRALHGEFEYVFRVILQRLPQTTNLLHLLRAIGSLGMEADVPKPTPEEDPFGDFESILLDKEQTEDLYRGLIDEYLQLVRQRRIFPIDGFRTLYFPVASQWFEELGLLGQLVLGGRDDEMEAADYVAEIQRIVPSVDNPVGKLLLILVMPMVDQFARSGVRREAIRRGLLYLLEERLTGPGDTFGEDQWLGLPRDPFSGQSFQFISKRRLYYSIGENQSDDGGSGNGANWADSPDLLFSLAPVEIFLLPGTDESG